MQSRQIEVRRRKLPYTNVKNDLIWDSRLRLQTRFALIAMLSLPDDWDYSIRGMAAKLEVSKDTMARMLKELEESSGHRPQLLAAPQQDQVSLEALGEAEVIDRLRRTQPDTLSPMEALNLLYELKQKLP